MCILLLELAQYCTNQLYNFFNRRCILEETVTNNANLSEVIINTINSLLGSLFSSIANSVYDTLDSLAFLDTSILNDSFFERTFGQGSNSGLLFIANSLLTAVCIYYCFKLIQSHFTGIQIERPYQFVFKLLIFGIFINCSFFICELFIYFTSLISDAIRGVGINLLGEEICFSNLIENLNVVEGCKVFCLFVEMPDSTVSVSLRSSDISFPVRKYAVFYGGGGHDLACGCSLSGHGQVCELLDRIKEDINIKSL